MSTLDLANFRTQPTVCSHCGRPIDRPRHQGFVEYGFRILVGLALTSLVVPLTVFVWKSCSYLVSDRLSHSIIIHPLEDWTRF